MHKTQSKSNVSYIHEPTDKTQIKTASWQKNYQACQQHYSKALQHQICKNTN